MVDTSDQCSECLHLMFLEFNCLLEYVFPRVEDVWGGMEGGHSAKAVEAKSCKFYSKKVNQHFECSFNDS